MSDLFGDFSMPKETVKAGRAGCSKCGKFVGNDYYLMRNYEDIYDQEVYCGKCAKKLFGFGEGGE